MIKFSGPSFKILLVLLVLVFLSVLMLISINQTLDEYTKVAGEVVESEATTFSNSKGGASGVYRIKLKNLDLNFGIKQYDPLYDYFINNDPKGKELTIYYDAQGQHVADNLTLHVGQVELGKEMLLSFEDSKAIYYLGLLVFGVLFIIFIPFYIWILRIEKRKNPK